MQLDPIAETGLTTDRATPADTAIEHQQGYADGVLDHEPSVRYGYRVGVVGFLVQQGLTSEVIQDPVIYPLPRTTRALAGVINQRGNLVPVFDMKNVLNLAPESAGPVLVLILGKGDLAAGILIDGVPKAVPVTLQPCAGHKLPEVLDGYVRHGFSANGLDWLELDYQGFFKHLATASGDCDSSPAPSPGETQFDVGPGKILKNVFTRG